jgi:hypothetical protein
MIGFQIADCRLMICDSVRERRAADSVHNRKSTILNLQLLRRVPPGERDLASSDGDPGTNGAISKTRCGAGNKDQIRDFARRQFVVRARPPGAPLFQADAQSEPSLFSALYHVIRKFVRVHFATPILINTALQLVGFAWVYLKPVSRLYWDLQCAKPLKRLVFA